MLGLRSMQGARLLRPKAGSTIRSFSALPRTKTAPLRRPAISSANPSWRPHHPSAILSMASFRFNSTETAPAAAAAAAEVKASAVPDYIPDTFPTGLDPTAPPPVIDERAGGFLEQLGLDHGWGPTGLADWFIEHVHVYSGLPWWGTILASAVTIRILLFPLFIKMGDASARMNELAPHAQPMIQEIRKAQAAGDMVAMNLAHRRMKALYEKAGVQRKWLGVPFLNIPIFYGFYRALTDACALPVPGMLNGGALWFTNLTIPDPYFLLPAMTSGLIAMQFYFGGETGQMNFSRNIRLFLIYGLPLMSFAFFQSFPAGITLYFFFSTCWGVLQGRIFRSEKGRKILGMHPLKKSAEQNPVEVLKSLSLGDTAKQTLSPQKPVVQSATTESLLDKLAGLDKGEKPTGMGLNLQEVKEKYLGNSKDRQYEAYEKRRAERKKAEQARKEAERRARRQQV